MQLKPNTGLDVSDYQPNLLIGSLSPLPRFVIIKATESILFKAKLTKDFAAQCKALGIPYGFYHFWQNTDPFKQASNFIAQVNAAGGFERIPPVLDLEVANLAPNSANIKVWLDVVEDVAGMRPILYSNKYHFDMIASNSWFKNYDAWTAAYPADPDLWSWCPPLYSEKRARREIIWQYGSTYRYPNYTANSVDTNIATSEWLNEIGAITPPSNIADGYQQLRRNDADVYLWRGAPKRVHVTNTGGKLETVSSAAKRLGADFAINGDGWVGGVDVPLSYAASDGNFYQRVSFDARPYFSATQANGYSINHVTPTAPYNLVSGTRYLVKAGANVYAGSTDPNYTSVLHPRTAIGITNDGKIVLCVVDGRSTQSAGMTLQNLAALMMEAGAVWALEMDGGGSSAMVKSGVVQNVPSDGTERAVSNHLLIYTEGQTMYTGNAKITATPNVRLRQANADGTANPTGTTIGAIQPGQAFKADLLSPDKAWLRITEIGGKTVQALYNKPYGYSATLYLDYKEVVVTPPPVEPPPPVVDAVTLDIVLHDVKVAGDKYEVLGVKAIKVP